MSELTITVLVENSAPEGLEAEHGLSFWLVYRGACWLLDSGSTGLFGENARRLGIDLSRAEGAILSHGHYDHSGGFPAFFAANPQAPVWLRQACREKCWHRKEGELRYIGISQGMLDQYPERFRFLPEGQELAPGLHILPHAAPGFSRRGERNGMLRGEGDRLLPDDFLHEQTLVAETEEGLVVLNSCTHAGAVETVREVCAAFPGRPIRAFLGGLHLGLKGLTYPPEEVREMGRRLLELGVREVYTGHCTGAEGFAILKEVLGERLRPLTTGLTVTF